jgi:hypothetical protein
MQGLEPRTNQTEGNEGNEVSRKLEKIGIFGSFACHAEASAKADYLLVRTFTERNQDNGGFSGLDRTESFRVFRGQIACSG